jgi:hypothetical protein
MAYDVSPHVVSTAIVLEDMRLVYVPVPKAASTAVLWALADLGGLGADQFAGSLKFETTRALTIHDMSIWGDSRRLGSRPADVVRQLFESPEWLTFTLVREPVRRIWSAWVGKVLLREPRFAGAYGDEVWFPPVPYSADDVVLSFRRFVRAISERANAWRDRHWVPQAELLGTANVAYDVVGRVEALPSALAVVDEHLRARGAGPLALRPANPSLLTFVAELLDEDAWERLRVSTEPDRLAFGYDPVARGNREPDEAWRTGVEARLPALRALIERNERVGDLVRLATRSRAS